MLQHSLLISSESSGKGGAGQSLGGRNTVSYLFILKHMSTLTSVAPCGNTLGINEIENKQKEGDFQMLLSIKILFS